MPTIAVYAGHGGSDPGAVSNGLLEKDINLALSNETTRLLRQMGYNVINNRTIDVNRDIRRDANLANSANVDAVVEIHMNSNAGVPGSGTEVIYSVFDTGKGRALASAIQRNIVALGFKDRGVKTRVNSQGEDELGIIRLTNAPAVLVEAAFINNPEDMARFDNDKVSKAIADGIAEIFPITAPPLPLGDPIIQQIQQTLNQRYDTGLAVDGLMGPKTRSALVKGLQTELNLQYDRNLTVDGVFGPQTKASAVTVKPGARGNITWLIQAALYGRSYRKVIPDGVYGSVTEAMVRAFQNDQNLLIDGIAGPNTQALLF